MKFRYFFRYFTLIFSLIALIVSALNYYHIRQLVDGASSNMPEGAMEDFLGQVSSVKTWNEDLQGYQWVAGGESDNLVDYGKAHERAEFYNSSSVQIGVWDQECLLVFATTEDEIYYQCE